MSIFKKLSMALLLTMMMAACSNMDSNLEKMIPADATGVVSMDVPQILKKAQMTDGGKIVLPQSLQQAIDENDATPMSVLLTDLPMMGIDTDSKAYAFFTVKTFGTVLLVALDDPDKARKTLSQRVGSDFTNVEGLECIYNRDKLYAIDGKVLLVGKVNKQMEASRVARAARNILSKSSTSIMDNKEIKQLLHNDDAAINMWFQLKGLKALLNKSNVYRELSQRMPLIEIFTESDIDAVECHVDLDDDEVEMKTNIRAAQDSEYAQLLGKTMGKPDNQVLKAIPNSMDYIVTMCVKGEQFVQLEQIKQLLGMFGKLPYIGRIDMAQILATVDGPFTVGLARDPHLEGEWNVVLATRSSNPQGVIQQINNFANSMGQAPELYDGEYVYQYDNKMIRIGLNDEILYVKMLDYEQTEGYAYEMPQAREFFEDALLGMFAQTHNQDNTHGYFDFALTDFFNGEGHFTTDMPNANPTLELLRALCTFNGPKAYDNNEDSEDDEISSLMGGAIDKLQPLN